MRPDWATEEEGEGGKPHAHRPATAICRSSIPTRMTTYDDDDEDEDEDEDFETEESWKLRSTASPGPC